MLMRIIIGLWSFSRYNFVRYNMSHVGLFDNSLTVPFTHTHAHAHTHTRTHTHAWDDLINLKCVYHSRFTITS